MIRPAASPGGAARRLLGVRRRRQGGGGLRRLAGRRLLAGLLTLLVLSMLVFAGTELLPGNAARAVLGQQATPSAVAAMNRELGTDRPAVARYLDWLGDAVRLDFGHSLTQGVGSTAGAPGSTGTPVASLISAPLQNTGALVLTVLVILVPGSLILGTLTALRAGSRVDQLIQSLTLAFAAVPEFVIGVMLIAVLALWLGLLPAVSLTVTPRQIVLPAATLALTSLAWTARLVRAGVIEVLASDYVEMARLKGLPERRVVIRHVLPNSVGPTLQAFALTIGYLAGGVVVVEYLFSYPGVGQGLLTAVQTRDIPTVEAYTMIIAGVYVVANLLADILAAVFNPRLRDA